MNPIIQHPWKYRIILHIGGCKYIGFDTSTDLLLICSTAGRGIIDCVKGTVIARDHTEYEPDALSNAVGIAPLENVTIKVFSTHNRNTSDANRIDTSQSAKWTLIDDIRESVFLVPPCESVQNSGICIYSKKDGASSLSAYAISPREKYIAVATFSEVFIMSKECSTEMESSYQRHDNFHGKIKYVSGKQ